MCNTVTADSFFMFLLWVCNMVLCCEGGEQVRTAVWEQSSESEKARSVQAV